ncbi:ankyrin repeat-containing domain protein [Xylaria sp. FL1777]|nr:ankyrin repeat-containing domain protein [Xylaria sp. FL1777]
MSCLSPRHIWRRSRSKIGKRELATSPTSVVGSSRTDDHVQIAATPSSTPIPTAAIQLAPDALQTPHIQPLRSDGQASNGSELPEPYATASGLWEEALRRLKESGKDEDIVAIERLIGESDSDPSKRSTAKSLAMELQEKVEDAFKKKQHDNKAADIIEKALLVVMKFASVADVAVNADPLHAALPWAAVRFVLMGLTASIELRSQLLATITIVASLFVQCERYQQLYLAPDPALRPPEDAMESLKESIVEAYTKSQVFLGFALNQQKGKSRHVVAAFKLGEVESYTEGLSKCEEKLLRAAEYCEDRCNFSNRSNVMELLNLTKNCHQSIQDQFKIALNRMNVNEQIKMLEWISPVQYGKHHKRIEEARTSGTCEWLLQDKEFRKWDEANSSVILWLQGSPGAGKTFLTSKVINHTQDRLESSPNQEGLAFFYCDRNDEERRNPLSVLQSYVRQLSSTVEHPGSVRPQLLSLYKQKRQKASELSFDDCANQLLESVNLYRKTTLVLDALDECDPDSRKKIIKTIEDLLSASKRPLKIFISSRPDRDIRSKFRDKPNIDIQATHNEDDIRKFVHEEIINHGGWEDMSAGLQKKIVTTLLEHSQGMFQWVFLQIKQILRLETEAAILDRLGKLPPDLKTTYDEIYEGINARNEHDKAIADNAFKWVMCADPPFNSLKLLSAIRVYSEKDTFGLSECITESQLLHLCNNLLVIDSQRQIWRFSHLSVAEYFEENHWSRPKAHSYAAKVCLKILIETYKDPSGQANTRIFSDFQNDNLYLRHPFQSYVRLNWITHIQAQEGEAADSALTQLLKSFLGSPEKSNVLYRRWHQDRENLSSSPWRWRSFNESLPYPPSNVALFMMCRFSFYNILLDWWEHAEFDALQTCDKGPSLLGLAAIGGCKPICENLVQRAMDANLPLSDFLGSSLHIAASYGRTEIAKFLISKGADVNTRAPDHNGWLSSVLSQAAHYGNLEIVRCLVQAGAIIDMPIHGKNCRYGSALAAAAGGGLRSFDTVKFLVEQAEANVNMHLQHGFYGSALAAAAYHESFDTVKFLVKQAGANVNMDLQYGKYGSALAAAAAAGGSISILIVKFLVIQAGANVNMHLQYGRYGSALAAAVAAEGFMSILIVEFLVKQAGADVNMNLQHGDYGSALAAAAFSPSFDTVKFLVEKAEADVNMQLQHGYFGSALAAAAARGAYREVATFLLDAGADPNQQIQNGMCGSALAAAAFWGQKWCAEGLIKAGAKVNLILEKGPFRTALQATQPDQSQDKRLRIPWHLPSPTLEQDRAKVAELLRRNGATDEV